MKKPIYLDYNATTPVDPRALDRMLPYFSEQYGNASSKGHAFGWVAAEAVKQAREEVAALMHAEPSSILFTGGATESINAAIRGVAAAYARKGEHIITVHSEHKAVIETCQAMEKQGLSVTYLPVDDRGLVDLDALEDALNERTILVSIMWANNETGVIQPIPEIARRIRSGTALFMTDATQALGKIPVDVEAVDILACSAHKMYGPKGVGALYRRRRNPRVRLVPFITGGSQEDNMRGGTLNVPGIVGFGAAASLASNEMNEEARRLRALRDDFEHRIMETLPDVRVNGAGAPRLPHVSNMTFRGVPSAHLVTQLRELAMSTGSACSTGSGTPSHVLKAMGLTDDEALASLRISLGRFTTEAEVQLAAGRIVEAVQVSRNATLAPVSGP